MTHIEGAGPLMFIDLLRGAPVPRQRKPYERPAVTGAGKLAEAEHFDEARMQLASVLDLDDANAEAQDLLRAVDEADVHVKGGDGGRRPDGADAP